MYYELYTDSLFLLNFTLNLYILLLINRRLHHTATRWRLFWGAVWSGAGYCMMFFLPLPWILKLTFGAVCAGMGSLVFTFRPSGVKGILKLVELAFFYAFLTGGAFLMLMNHVKLLRSHMMPWLYVVACGGIFTLIFYKREIQSEKQQVTPCVVELCKGERKVQIRGLVDTGNSLTEPVSGKPVSVVDKEIFESLWGQEKEIAGLRAIPYRSVGCDRGIMWGFELPEMVIMQEGMKKICRNIYVGISEKKVSSTGTYQMLVNPGVLKQ